MLSDSPQPTEPTEWLFVCPEGKTYHVGERIPVHRAAEGIIFNEMVVKVVCPGFEGMRMCKSLDPTPHSLEIGTQRGCCVLIDELEGEEDCFFVGPESQAWRWEYARKEIMRNKAFKIHENAKFMEAVKDLGDS